MDYTAIIDFANKVSAYASVYMASCTSWGRTVAHSISVGGFDGDPHTWWLGADLVYDNVSAVGTADQRIEKARLMGLWLIPEADHDHIQPIGWVNKPH